MLQTLEAELRQQTSRLRLCWSRHSLWTKKIYLCRKTLRNLILSWHCASRSLEATLHQQTWQLLYRQLQQLSWPSPTPTDFTPDSGARSTVGSCTRSCGSNFTTSTSGTLPIRPSTRQAERPCSLRSRCLCLLAFHASDVSLDKLPLLTGSQHHATTRRMRRQHHPPSLRDSLAPLLPHSTKEGTHSTNKYTRDAKTIHMLATLAKQHTCLQHA